MSKAFCALMLLFALSASAVAEDLGTKGAVSSPDRDARDQLRDQVRAKQKSGEIDRFWQQYRERAIDAIKNPKSLGIPSNYDSRVEMHDLKFVLPQDYYNEKHEVVARKGAVIEPLKIHPLTMGLIFIDGTDQSQIDYAIAQTKIRPLKIVLTAGSPYALRVKYQGVEWNGTPNIPFYFDQKKIIINTMRQLYGIQINTVPAMLIQQGSRLQINFGMRK